MHDYIQFHKTIKCCYTYVEILAINNSRITLPVSVTAVPVNTDYGITIGLLNS